MEPKLFAKVLHDLKSGDSVADADLIEFIKSATELRNAIRYINDYSLVSKDLARLRLMASDLLARREQVKRKIPRSKPPVSVTAGHTILDYDLGRSMGMTTVAANGWTVVHTQSSDFKGSLLSAFKIASRLGGFPQITHHELDNTRYSTQEESARAAYNAGLLDLYYYVG